MCIQQITFCPVVGLWWPIARLIERGVHVKNVWASGHRTYNLIRFKLIMLVNTCIIL